MKGPNPDILLLGQVDTHSARPSGTKTYVRLLAKALSAEGKDVVVWSLGPRNRSAAGTVFDMRSIPNVLRFWPRLAAKLFISRIPVDMIVHVQRPEELWPVALLKPFAKIVVTVHGPHWITVRRKFGRTAAFVYDVLMAVALLRANRVVVVSDELARLLLSRFSWLDEKTRIIPPMVDSEEFAPIPREVARRSLRLPVGIPLVLHCGRLEGEKNVGLLLEAVALVGREVPECTLLFCGSGYEQSAIARKAEELGIPTIFLGDVRPEKMAAVYGSSNVLVITSMYEGLPTVILEALACGRPVVSRRFRALVNLYVPGGLLQLVEGSEASMYAVRIAAALKGNPENQAPPPSLQDYSRVSVAKRILGVYEELL